MNPPPIPSMYPMGKRGVTMFKTPITVPRVASQINYIIMASQHA